MLNAIPHLYRVIESDIEKVACAAPPEGPGFSTGVVARADRMEVWASSCSEPGDDWTEFKLYRGSRLLDKQRIKGY